MEICIKDAISLLLLVIFLIFIFIMKLIQNVPPDPVTFENVFCYTNIRETFKIGAIVCVIFVPIYYLWNLEPKYKNEKEKPNKWHM
jgi:Holliday junction resolvasome RuvABC endonuclease subunit